MVRPAARLHTAAVKQGKHAFVFLPAPYLATSKLAQPYKVIDIEAEAYRKTLSPAHPVGFSYWARAKGKVRLA